MPPLIPTKTVVYIKEYNHTDSYIAKKKTPDSHHSSRFKMK